MRQFEELVQRFKQHGYKLTSQRRAILRAIAESPPHPTAEQIYDVVRQLELDTSLATVYNTLRELVAIEELCELDLGEGVRRYERSLEEHAHLVCLRCGQIEDVPVDIARLRSLLQLADRFQPTRYCITVYGTCASCAASLSSD